MISWIQKTFQQHFRVLFLVLLAVVIISFVFTIGAAPGTGQHVNKELNRPFFGVNLGNPEDQQRVFGDASLSVFLQAGYPALQGAQLQEYGLQRFAAVALADQLNVPAPTTQEIADRVKTFRAFAGENGEFDAQRYSQFRDNLRSSPELKEADVTRVIADDIRYERVQQLIAGPGYVLPADVRQQLERTDTAWTLQVATVDYASFAPEIKPTDVQLTQYFEENGFRYDIPAQVRVRKVEFPAAAFVGQVTLTDAEIRAYYDANPARFPKPADAAAQPTPNVGGGDADFAAVRGQVEAALRLERARALANKAAADFTLALFEGQVARANVDSFLAARNLRSAPVAPFSRGDAPAELGVSSEAANQAFRLDDKRYFSDPLETGSGSLVLLWEENLAQRKPAFPEVREKVAADYSESEKRKRFVEAGRSVKELIQTRMKAGESFEKAVASATGTTSAKVETKSYPSFTLRTRPQDLDFAVLGTLETLQQGSVSDMVLTGDKGFIVFATEKKAPDMSETSAQFAEAREQLSRSLANRTASEILNHLVQQELEKSGVEKS